MMRVRTSMACLFMALVIPGDSSDGGPEGLLADPSFEITKERDQFGFVFARWGGWKYEGDCEFRVGQLGHTGAAFRACFRAGSGPRYGLLRMSRWNRAGIA